MLQPFFEHFAILCLALAISVNPGSAKMAEDGPSFDCAKVQSSVEKLVCADSELASLDRLVSKRFNDAVAVVKTLDAGAKDAEDELRALQRGWISGRDDCWKQDDLRACVENAYLRREGALVARYMLEEPTNAVTWLCNDNPANEVVTYFFDTTLSSVRIEYGDIVDVGSSVRTASGARYEASFGRSIWIKGDDAMIELTQGETMNCRARK